MIKNTTRVLIAVSALAMAVSGCASLPKSEAEVILPPSLDCEISMDIDGHEYIGDLLYTENSTSLTLRSPSSMRGMVITDEAGEISIDFSSFRFSAEKAELPVFGAVNIISDCLGAIKGKTARQAPDSTMIVSADLKAGKAEVVLEEKNFYPRTISISEINFMAQLSPM